MYERASWRLLESGVHDGPTNMAVDEAILESVAAGESPPTLRFYGWEPACLSLGFAQPWAVVEVAACRARGWDVVRRPTGGRAILHVDEVTYSVCLPQDEPRVQGGILASYRRLSDALADGLALLGLDPARAVPQDGARAEAGPACFDGPSNYEITAGSRKLVGSAQARKRGVVLQHGSLPLYGDVSRIVQGLVAGEAQRAAMGRRLRTHATTLEESLGRRTEAADVIQALCRGFAGALNLALEAGCLSGEEKVRAQAIRAEKYANEAWTQRI